jgi:hypothetical protein
MKYYPIIGTIVTILKTKRDLEAFSLLQWNTSTGVLMYCSHESFALAPQQHVRGRPRCLLGGNVHVPIFKFICGV